MRVHHLNCGTCCPVGGRFMDGVSAGVEGRIVCHCLLIESDRGLILVDTGLGTRDVANPARMSKLFRNLLNVQLRPHETAIAQVRALGFAPEDVRHIVLSHLDFDHAGGIEDFPWATVHCLARERDAARALDGGVTGPMRYLPAQWDEVSDWRVYRAGGERWHGFDAVRDLQGLPPEILLVPLAGHTWGHAGIAVAEPDGWLFYAGDAYMYRGEVGLTRPQRTPGTTLLQTTTEVDRAARLMNQARLRRLSIDRADEVRMFCAHDAVEFDLLAARG